MGDAKWAAIARFKLRTRNVKDPLPKRFSIFFGRYHIDANNCYLFEFGVEVYRRDSKCANVCKHS